MRRVLIVLVLALVAAGGYFVYRQSTAAPEIPFAVAKNESIVDILSTNGKVEPIEWAQARSEREGVLRTLNATKGQRIDKGSVLATIDSAEAESAVAQAEARIAQIEAEIQTLNSGGRQAEIAEIDGAVTRARVDLKIAQTDLDTVEKLIAKQAAPANEAKAARDRMEQTTALIRTLQSKRASLVGTGERGAAEARLREARSALDASKRRAMLGVVRSPIGGTIYQADLKTGAFVAPGAVIASIGNLSRLRVKVNVDEPELGRVAIGMPVTITWDALAGKEWKGTVEKLPVEIVALNTRQIGEVQCVIDNPGGELYPGANITAAIRSRVVESALAIPKEAIMRQGTAQGVYVLQADGRIAWRQIKIGVSNITRSQVLGGVQAGDAVALPTELTLKDGMAVRRAKDAQ